MCVAVRDTRTLRVGGVCLRTQTRCGRTPAPSGDAPQPVRASRPVTRKETDRQLEGCGSGCRYLQTRPSMYPPLCTAGASLPGRMHAPPYTCTHPRTPAHPYSYTHAHAYIWHRAVSIQRSVSHPCISIRIRIYLYIHIYFCVSASIFFHSWLSIRMYLHTYIHA